MDQPTTTPRGALLRRFAQVLLQFAFLGGVCFTSAGTLRWPGAWLFLGLSVLGSAAIGAWVLPRNPEVIAERGRTHRDTRAFDRVVTAVYAVLYLALFVTAGLGVRLGAAPGPGWPGMAAGAALLLLALVPIAGAMAVNRNLETTVRLQTERGHAVADRGPYRVVRHPMYVGMLVQGLATPLVLDAPLALVPAALAGAAMVVRTALEDRMLRRELPGYEAFARSTRWRLLPGVW